MDVNNTDAIQKQTNNARDNFGNRLRVPIKLAKITMHILLGLFLVITLGFWISHQHSIQRQLTQWWLRKIGHIVDLRVHVTGLQSSQPVLFVSNHISWLDIIVIGSHIPVRFLSKEEVRQWPVIGWLAKNTGTLFIKRGSGKSQEIADVIAKEIIAGESILVFPEATSTSGKQIKRFFPNMFDAAIQANASVQPIALQYFENGQLSDIAPFINNDDFFEHLMRVVTSDHIDVTMQILGPIAPQMDMNRKTLSSLSRDKIIEATTKV